MSRARGMAMAPEEPAYEGRWWCGSGGYRWSVAGSYTRIDGVELVGERVMASDGEGLRLNKQRRSADRGLATGGHD